LTISLPGIPREHLSQMAPASPAYRWSLVAVLAWAGFISGVYTTIIIRIMSDGTANQYPFTFFGSLCFGLAMCSVLWAFGFVSSGRAGVTLVAATIAVHLIDVFVTEKNILRWVMVEHSLVALALYSTFLLVLVRGRRKLWTLLVAPACAALTVVVVYYIVRVADSFVVTQRCWTFPHKPLTRVFLRLPSRWPGSIVEHLGGGSLWSTFSSDTSSLFSPESTCSSNCQWKRTLPERRRKSRRAWRTLRPASISRR
jgi:hypothetical protein